MNPLLVSIIVTLAWFVYMFLAHGVILKSMASANPVIGDPDPKKAPAIFVTMLITSIILVYIVVSHGSDGMDLNAAAFFGLLIGFLVEFNHTMFSSIKIIGYGWKFSIVSGILNLTGWVGALVLISILNPVM